ncbi:hypothetical protein [Phenylobacterium sp.]|jgi:hypothetical protein|uniref:hypothetical protein n=1 Tax=Phenylobacterium sp. TaxID=1871053 RepID=UPI002E33E618|nr:hypothetical protein [Phenylobacterium sp.]HEX4711752.1 hypothetical protein [Phenylobacterium sp.]
MISAILAAAVLLADTTATLQAPADAAAKPTAATQTVAQAATAGKKQNDPSAMVCKSEPVLGSRLPTKRCRTQAQIDSQRLEDRQAIERAQILAEPGH